MIAKIVGGRGGIKSYFAKKRAASSMQPSRSRLLAAVGNAIEGAGKVI
jgi:hypothetical protein